jgi:hypothetical protein
MQIADRRRGEVCRVKPNKGCIALMQNYSQLGELQSAESNLQVHTSLARK